MNYETAMEPYQTISRQAALAELAKHSVSSSEELKEFFSELGDHKEYKSKDVLVWLGY